MLVTTSVPVIQVLRFYCNYAGGNFYYGYVGGSFCCNHAAEVYSSTNWPPFTGGQKSILNWVLKLSLLNQKEKSNKNCLDYLERALFILFLPLGVINGVKSSYKKKNET